MRQLIFSTGNSQKFGKGQETCSQYDIELIQKELDIDEVQSEDTEYVARRKAETAYQLVKQPVIISDDAWKVFGLNGFPGTYAKSVNTWFTADDYLRLTKDLADRRITLVQTLVYQDRDRQQLFTRETVGTLLKDARGSAGAPIQKITTLDPKTQKSISEMIGDHTHYSHPETTAVWHDFAKWFTEQHA